MQPATTLFVLVVTHVVGGVAAFGSALLALPLLLLIGWDLQPAVALVVIVGLVQALQMTLATWRGADRKALVRILVVAGIGIPIGFVVAGLLPERSLGALLGGLLIAAGASRLLERRAGREWSPPRWAMNALLLAGGVVHGAFGTGGATLTIYGRYAFRDKEAFRGTLSIMWLILNVFVLARLLLQGHAGRTVLLAALPGVPAVILATWAGERIARRLSREQFAAAVAVLLCAAGVLTACRSIDMVSLDFFGARQ